MSNPYYSCPDHFACNCNRVYDPWDKRNYQQCQRCGRWYYGRLCVCRELDKVEREIEKSRRKAAEYTNDWLEQVRQCEKDNEEARKKEAKAKAREEKRAAEALAESERQARIKAGLEAFVALTKVVVLAWADNVVDDTMRRFSLLEF